MKLDILNKIQEYGLIIMGLIVILMIIVGGRFSQTTCEQYGIVKEVQAMNQKSHTRYYVVFTDNEAREYQNPDDKTILNNKLPVIGVKYCKDIKTVLTF